MGSRPRASLWELRECSAMDVTVAEMAQVPALAARTDLNFDLRDR